MKLMLRTDKHRLMIHGRFVKKISAAIILAMVFVAISSMAYAIDFSEPLKGYRVSKDGGEFIPNRKIKESQGAHLATDCTSSSSNYNVYPIYPGVVKKIYTKNDEPCGRFIILEHKYNGVTFYSEYQHLASISVSVGSNVSKETVLGKYGQSGNGYDDYNSGYGKHLHYAIYTGPNWSQAWGDKSKFTNYPVNVETDMETSFGNTFYNPDKVIRGDLIIPGLDDIKLDPRKTCELSSATTLYASPNTGSTQISVQTPRTLVLTHKIEKNGKVTWYKTSEGYFIQAEYVKNPQDAPAMIGGYDKVMDINCVVKFKGKFAMREEPYQAALKLYPDTSNLTIRTKAIYINKYNHYWIQFENGAFLCANNVEVVTQPAAPTASGLVYPTGDLALGKGFELQGKVTCSSPMQLTAIVHNVATKEDKTASIENVTSVDIYNSKLNTGIKFGSLAKGNYTYSLGAFYYQFKNVTSDSERPVELTKAILVNAAPFTVGGGSSSSVSSKLQFVNVTYPATYKINNMGWNLSTGSVVSSVQLSTIQSTIAGADGKVISDKTRTISGTSYNIKSLDTFDGTDNGVRFSYIKTAGDYTWTLKVTDVNGQSLRLVMPIKAVTSGSTVTAVGNNESSDEAPPSGDVIDWNIVQINMPVPDSSNSGIFTNPDFTLPTSLTKVAPYAFKGIAAKRIYVFDLVTEIGSQAFANCPSMECIYIPKSVTIIAEDAFTGTNNVTIYCDEGSAALTFAINHNLKYVVVKVPEISFV